MRRRVLLLLTTMALALVVSSGTAMAEEPHLDQHQTATDGHVTVTFTAYQIFTAGRTGNLDKVSLYIGVAQGATPGDLSISVREERWPFPRREVTIPASSFTNDGSLRWVDIPFASPLRVEGGVDYSISLRTPAYIWGNSSADVYSRGYLTNCQPPYWPPGSDIPVRPCGVVGDAAFKTYVPDTTPPQTTIWSGPSGTVSDTDALFYFYSNEDSSTFECRLDSTSEDDWVECSSPWPYSGLSEGSHTFEVRATDSSGNTDPFPASRTWTVDLPDPPPPPPVIPHITDTDPNNGDTGVARTIKPTVVFDTDLDPATINRNSVRMDIYNAKKKRWVTISSTLSYDNRVMTVTPTNALGSQKRYRVVLNTGIESSTDTNLEQPFSFRFTTRR